MLRFGPTLAAGTAIVEQDAEKGIIPAPFGSTAYAGITEKGGSGLIVCNSLSDFVRKCGGYIDGTELPDAAVDFFRFGEGAGTLFVQRVTDGNEVASGDKAFSRHTGRGEFLNRDSGNTTKGVLLSISAKNGGRWGGAERVLRVEGFTIVSALTETTLSTGVTMLENDYAGAKVQLLGVTTKKYTVVGNTAAGVLTVESDSTMATDLADGTDSANNDAIVYLDNEIRAFNAPGSANGARKALGLVWKDGEEDPSNYFGLDILLDGGVVKSYANLSLDSSNKWYIANVINQDVSNEWITVTVDHAGSITPDNRPSNWAGSYQSFSGTTLTTQVARVATVSSTNTDVGFVTDWVIPSKCVRGRMRLVFTSPTAFDVTHVDGYGMASGGLAAGAVGTAYAPGDGFLPGFTVKLGVEAFTSGDVITIDVDPFPVDLSDESGVLAGWVYVNSGADRTRVSIDDNTSSTIVLKNAPASTVTADAAMSTSTDDTDIGTAITFPITSEAIEVSYVSDSDGYIAISLASATYSDIGEVIAALNGEQTGGSRDPFFKASADTSDAIAIDHSLVTSSNTGEECFVRIVTGSANLNVTDETNVTGVVGDKFRVEAPRTLSGGYDGSAPADSDYIAKYNTATSLYNRIRGRNMGLVKYGTPGVTTTAIQKAGIAYAAARNGQYRVEFPSAIADEASAVAYINDVIGRSAYSVTSWPSYGYVVNPIGSGNVLQTLTGAIHGREASVARNYAGYHKASAGESVTLPHVIDSPLGEAVINEEVTTPQGINVIKKMKGNFVLWGDRTLASDPGWKFKHQREYMSHIECILLEAFDWLIFAINDATERSKLNPVFRAFFYPEWRKRALRGAKFDDACSIKIDSENNTNLTIANGDMNASLGLRIADTVERFIITLGKKGIFDQAA